MTHKMKPHLFMIDGQWAVNLRGGRTWGWPFESFERACEFARNCSPTKAVKAGLVER